MRTPEEAFVQAYRILKDLEAIGVDNPHIALYSDGSGSVHLGPVERLKGIEAQKIFEIIGSRRVSWNSSEQDATISFCTALRTGVEDFV